MKKDATHPRPKVALLVETSNAYARQLLQGIRAYVREHGPWSIQLSEQARGNQPPDWLATWRGDGIIARVETEDIARAVQATRRPVVNVSASHTASSFPRVISDSAEIARLAVEHLVERGFRHLAYCGDGRFVWSKKHGENFATHARKNGLPCAVFPVTDRSHETWTAQRARMADWLQSLPKPVGIMACYDIRGQQLLDVCRQLEWPVPDEIAVIGQHNDDLLCDLCDPPLSSVIPNARQSGFEAAALLDRMMKGEKVKAMTIRVAPLGVATRQSTDVVALPDAKLADALTFIREHAGEAINVEDVLRRVPMSRTSLETRFKKLLGRTPLQHIMQVRMERVKQLLMTTDLPIAAVAERCGFEHTEYLNVAFKRVTGSAPGQYRRSTRR